MGGEKEDKRKQTVYSVDMWTLTTTAKKKKSASVSKSFTWRLKDIFISSDVCKPFHSFFQLFFVPFDCWYYCDNVTLILLKIAEAPLPYAWTNDNEAFLYS